MYIKEHKNILDIRNIYDLFYSLNESLCVDQSFEMINSCNNIQYLLKCKSKLYVYVVYNDNNEPILIAPFRKRGKTYSVAGSQEHFEFVDFIYSTNDFKILYKAINTLLSYISKKGFDIFEIKFLDEKSLTNDVIKKIYEDEKYSLESDNVNNVNIPIEYENYELYFSNLSKHTRQNVRTAYNRINKNNLKFEFHIYGINKEDTVKVKKAMHKKYLDLYKLRLGNQYKANYIGRLFKHFDYVSKTVMQDFGFMADICIDGKVVAFMEGHIDKKHNSIEIPRLAIDSEYGFYSPGLCLVNETVKYLMNNTAIKSLNLCRGDEQYKLNMGGQVYITNNYRIQLNLN